MKNLPVWMELLARIDPVAYGVDPLRQVVLANTVPSVVIEMVTRHPVGINVLAMVGFGVLFLVPAVWLFSRTDI
ncbi:MAG: hypothetical protein ACOC7U_04970 [Spirochaetota bacterium]